MLETGESVVTSARWLGHSSPAIGLGSMLTSCRTGSRGRTAVERTARGVGEIGRPAETPQMVPRPVDG